MNLRLKWPAGVLCCVLFLFGASATAQQANPVQDSPFKIQSSVNRLLVPAVVRDKQGRVVGDLKKEDFHVFDNDKPREVSGFSVVKSGMTGSDSANKPDGSESSAAADRTNTQAQSPVGTQRFIIFLFDDLHLNIGDLAYAQKADVKVLEGALSESDMAAVVSLSGKANSGLTRDRAKLQEAIMSLRPITIHQSSSANCPNIDYYQADLIENKHDPQALQDAEQQLIVCNPPPPAMLESTAEAAASRVLAIGQQDTQESFAALTAYVRKMATLPGQRTLVLVSSGFPVITPEALDAESRLINLATQSNVMISALDARGVYVTEVNASDDTRGRSPGEINNLRRSSMNQAENVMDQLSDGTGGTYFHHNNDLEAGFKSLTEAPEYLYLLELPLDDVKQNGAFHHLKVKVDRDGVKVQARRGYYMPKPEKHKK